jgi:hypothetical protein
MDNFDFDDDDDNVREALPIIKDKMLNIDEDYNEFKQSLLLNNDLDEDMREILLKSRYEYIENFSTKNKFNPDVAKKSEILKIFSCELLKKSQKDSIFNNLQKKVDKKMNDYIDGTIKEIKLDFEYYYEVENMINELLISFDKKEKLFNIFKPDNRQEYINYKMIIDISKQEAIELEKEKKDLEEEKIRRNTIINPLLVNLKKLSKFDTSTKILIEKIENSINDYLGLKTEKIILDDMLRDDLVKFIKSIRMTLDEKNTIISLT